MRIWVIAVVSLIGASDAFAATEKAELEALQTYCKPDIDRLCSGVEFGGGAVKACLQKHEKEMSVGCAQALKALKSK